MWRQTVLYAARVILQTCYVIIKAEIAGKGHLWTETTYFVIREKGMALKYGQDHQAILKNLVYNAVVSFDQFTDFVAHEFRYFTARKWRVESVSGTYS